MILCLWFPLLPISKLLAIQDLAQNLEEQLWMGGRREVSIISHRPVTRRDLKQERSFFVGVSQHFCNWLQLHSKRFWKCKKRPQLPDPCIQKNIIYLFHGPIIISTNCSEVTDFPKTFPILLLIIWSAYSVHSWLSCPICPWFIKYNTFRIFAIFKTALSNTAGCYPC